MILHLQVAQQTQILPLRRGLGRDVVSQPDLASMRSSQ